MRTPQLNTLLCIGGLTLAATMTTVDAGTISVPNDFATVQEAVDAAVNGDEIVIEPGTYVGTFNVFSKSVSLRSASGNPDDTILEASPGSHVANINGAPQDFIVDGLTFAGGQTYGLNLGTSSSGIATVTRCIFRDNMGSSDGGGVNDARGTTRFADCLFLNNTAVGRGGGLLAVREGGGSITRCRFIGNQAWKGGGVAFRKQQPGPAGYSMSSCLFTGNTATHSGGAVYVEWTHVTMTQCTFSQNTGPGTVAVVGNDGDTGTAVMERCIIWDNDATDLLVEGEVQNGAGAILGRSIVSTISANEFAWIVGSVLPLDPQFVDPLGPDMLAGTLDDDLRLQPTSPAIDLGCRGTALDLDGNPRFAGSCSDLGAYEVPGAVEETCAADINGDGEVGPPDLAALLEAWGLCD